MKDATPPGADTPTDLTGIRAVAFDCYGTIAQVTRPHGVHRTIAALVGGRISPSPMTVDRPLADIVREHAPTADPSEIAALDDDIRDEVTSVRALPGTVETIRSLRGRGIRVAIASNLARDYGNPLAGMFDVDHHAFSFQMGVAKPNTRFFRRLCAALGCHPGEVLMVGDSPRSDYQGALAAGMRAALVGGHAGGTSAAFLFGTGRQSTP